MTTLDDLKAFNLAAASVSLWVFKGPYGKSGELPKYTGRWTETVDGVDELLKSVVQAERNRVEEMIEYDLLAENNEASALSIPSEVTHSNLILETAAAETEKKRVQKVEHMRNSVFYVIKLVHEDTRIIAVRKTDAGWKTKRALTSRSLFFSENRLEVDERVSFSISNAIDFFVVGEDVLVLDKRNFEAVLRYKEAHKEDFIALQEEEDFASLFADMAPLISHVGENKIQLRRVSAIRQKGHYRDADFMDRLREHGAEFGLAIQFDGDGKIIVTPETCVEIITALLDHRLSSAFSNQIYDVPSSTLIGQ